MREGLRGELSFADPESYNSVGELVDQNLSGWEHGFESVFFGETHPESGEPTEVSDTRELLSLPEDELNKHGYKIDMLRGCLDYYDGDAESALQHIGNAQADCLKNGNISSYATASARRAKIAIETGFVDTAEQEHRNAIWGHWRNQELRNDELIAKGEIDPAETSVHSLKSFIEYRRLAETLGTESAVQEHGKRKLKALRKEIEGLNGVRQSEAVAGVRALTQTEYELSKLGFGGPYLGFGKHNKLAKQYSFLCSAADMSGGLGLQRMIAEQRKQPPTANSVKGWVKILKKGAPDMIVR